MPGTTASTVGSLTSQPLIRTVVEWTQLSSPSTDEELGEDSPDVLLQAIAQLTEQETGPPSGCTTWSMFVIESTKLKIDLPSIKSKRNGMAQRAKCVVHASNPSTQGGQPVPN